MDYVIIALIFFLFSWSIWSTFWALALRGNRRKLPPGPPPLPIIGNLHQFGFGGHPHKSLAELARAHGPIMTLKLGQITTVVISSSSMAREVLQRQDLAFSTRFVPDSIHTPSQHEFSVIWLPVGDRWRTLRRIMKSSMFSGNMLDASQQVRSRKVKQLMDHCRESGISGKAVDVGQATFTALLNSLSNTIFSKDVVCPSSDSIKDLKEVVWNILVEAGSPNMADYFPILKKMDPQGARRRMTIYFDRVFELFGSFIDERLRAKMEEKTKSMDVLDILLNSHSHEVCRNHVARMFLDLFVAGTDTTSSTVEWAMTELLRNPEVMKKAKEELRQIQGEGKQIEENQVDRLPYLQSIIKETLRIHPPAPLLVLRKVQADVPLFGFTVPKDAQVLVNAWAIGRDPQAWKNPLAFMPERFLETDVDVKGNHFELIPFGAGRRICPGLPLAMRIIPVILGSLINSFDWKVEGELVTEELFGLTLRKALPLRVVPLLL